MLFVDKAARNSCPRRSNQRHFNYEGNLSPGADRQAMHGEIKRLLPADKLRLFRHFVDREREMRVKTDIPSE
jgi:hypothetical protein